jgi:hypothetical protein
MIFSGLLEGQEWKIKGCGGEGGVGIMGVKLILEHTTLNWHSRLRIQVVELGLRLIL